MDKWFFAIQDGHKVFFNFDLIRQITVENNFVQIMFAADHIATFHKGAALDGMTKALRERGFDV